MKAIEFAYPTSPIANKLKKPKGCWFVDNWTPGNATVYPLRGYDSPDNPALIAEYLSTNAEPLRSFLTHGNPRALAAIAKATKELARTAGRKRKASG